MERRKVKNGEKSPWGQCLTRPVATVAVVLASDWCQKTCVFLALIRSQNSGDRHVHKIFIPTASALLMIYGEVRQGVKLLRGGG